MDYSLKDFLTVNFLVSDVTHGYEGERTDSG